MPRYISGHTFTLKYKYNSSLVFSSSSQITFLFSFCYCLFLFCLVSICITSKKREGLTECTLACTSTRTHMHTHTQTVTLQAVIGLRVRSSYVTFQISYMPYWTHLSNHCSTGYKQLVAPFLKYVTSRIPPVLLVFLQPQWIIIFILLC